MLLLPWAPWRTRERLEPVATSEPTCLADITTLIPARDEALHIGATLDSLFAQGKGLHVVVIDDRSGDATAQCVRSRAQQHPSLELLAGTALPEGWTGKLWALHQGLAQVRTEWVLLLDADIVLAPNLLAAAQSKCRHDGIDFVSIMASLRMSSFWERLLMPSFVFFFKLLYPFALSNAGSRWVSAAAGGFILCRRDRLEQLGGFAALRGEIIDDCSLARRMRSLGAGTWVGLSRSVNSQRTYDGLGEIWNMVARTAFNQLRYSVLLLLLATALLCATFLAPLIGILVGAGSLQLVAGLGLVVMMFVYHPTLRYYQRSPLWALLLPLSGGLYLAMTWTSALRYWRGEGSRWKGRNYARVT